MHSTKLLAALFISAFVGILFSSSDGQSRVNSSGTGGIHMIQGRIFLPNGRTLDSPVVVRLESTNFSTITLNTDHSGGFVFRSLAPGKYTIVVEAGDNFEIARESITIDTEIQVPGRRGAASKVFTIPIHLQLKRGQSLKNEVINARLANVRKEAVEHYSRGLEFAQTGKEDQAVKEFRRALSLHPQFADCLAELGQVLLKSGKLDDAIDSFRSALRIDPNNFDAKVNYGIALFAKSDSVNAETALAEAALLNRTAVTPHYYLGLLFIQRKNYDVAQKAMETARELKGEKDYPLVHKYLGGIYMAKHLNEQAIEELERYLLLSPEAFDAAKIRNTLAELKNKQN